MLAYASHACTPASHIHVHLCRCVKTWRGYLWELCAFVYEREMACVSVSEKGTERVYVHICGSRLRGWICHATCKHTHITYTRADEFRKLGMLLEQAGRVDMSVMRDEIDRVIAVSSLAASLAHADESPLSHDGTEVPHTAAAPRSCSRARTAMPPGTASVPDTVSIARAVWGAGEHGEAIGAGGQVEELHLTREAGIHHLSCCTCETLLSLHM